ncbi:hypothetical protein PybrP1_004297 [[Pythium] brassicae (nom. inval.)]|nr:hypothetical protein PybrP1_004297 [[Pythium] brassicae (nom. inval.)]
MDEHWRKPLAASIGAVLTSLVVTPLEVVKTRLQVQVPSATKVPSVVQQCSHYNFSNGLMDTMLPKEQLLRQCKCSAEQLSCAPKPNSVLNTMARIVRLEGPLALYAGLPPTLLLAVPSTALYFTSYELLLSKGKELVPGANHGVLAMLAGALARTGAASVFSPLELIRVRMQSGESAHSFVTHTRLAAKGGVRELYHGLGATLARDIPFSALYWLGIESAKPFLTPRVHIESAQKRQVVVALLAGMSAGAFATVATHPFDVVKTRKQASMYSASKVAASDAGGSALQMLQQVWQQEGFAGLYAGLGPRVAKVAPACAIMIGTYEAAKLAFERGGAAGEGAGNGA